MCLSGLWSQHASTYRYQKRLVQATQIVIFLILLFLLFYYYYILLQTQLPITLNHSGIATAPCNTLVVTHLCVKTQHLHIATTPWQRICIQSFHSTYVRSHENIHLHTIITAEHGTCIQSWCGDITPACNHDIRKQHLHTSLHQNTPANKHYIRCMPTCTNLTSEHKCTYMYTHYVRTHA